MSSPCSIIKEEDGSEMKKNLKWDTIKSRITEEKMMTELLGLRVKRIILVKLVSSRVVSCYSRNAQNNGILGQEMDFSM